MADGKLMYGAIMNKYELFGTSIGFAVRVNLNIIQGVICFLIHIDWPGRTPRYIHGH